MLGKSFYGNLEFLFLKKSSQAQISRKTGWKKKRRDFDETARMGRRSSFEHSKARNGAGTCQKTSTSHSVRLKKVQKHLTLGKDGQESSSRILGTTRQQVSMISPSK